MFVLGLAHFWYDGCHCRHRRCHRAIAWHCHHRTSPNYKLRALAFSDVGVFRRVLIGTVGMVFLLTHMKSSLTWLLSTWIFFSLCEGDHLLTVWKWEKRDRFSTFFLPIVRQSIVQSLTTKLNGSDLEANSTFVFPNLFRYACFFFSFHSHQIAVCLNYVKCLMGAISNDI